MMIERDKIETSRLDGVEVLGIGEGDRVCDPPSFLLISNSSETGNLPSADFEMY